MADQKRTDEAARLKAGGGLSYADCFASGLAMQEDGAVATGDPEFEAVESEVTILWIDQRPGRP